MSEYSPVNEEQIKVLKEKGNYADDWSKILVTKDFNPERVIGNVFKGEIKIGRLSKKFVLNDGIERASGIYRAKLNNVEVGDDCYIADVNNWISNIDIDENVIIENVGEILCTGDTTFGNGHSIEVLNEGGGRELKITNLTSSQIAYLTVLYRDKEKLIEALDKIAEKYAESVKRKRGFIGKNTIIMNTTSIVNVYIGENAEIKGVMSLKEGTVNSSSEAKTVVENGVIAEDFIFQLGSSVKEGAIISGAIVGEGTKIGEQFSAKNCVFFANSEGFHSEACSAFCGPYTVTHHRSTLLIAGLFSFYNAGSGTNQSNHMYKLGPLHQGILERGCKTGSFSYLLWPSRVGAFTAVIGKHYANFDTSDLPFSYITEEGGKSIITPAMNYFTVGTLRDGEKWPARDRRKNSKKLDLIIFDVLSPYTAQKMIKATKILQDLYDNSERGQEYVKYNGINIKRVLLRTNKKYYQLAINKYFGDVLLKKIKKENINSIDSLKTVLKPFSDGIDGNSEWIDVSGLLCAKPRIDNLISNIESGKIDDFEKLQNALEGIYNSYEKDEWNFFLAKYKEVNGKDIADNVEENINDLITKWKESSLKLLDMVLVDASKEFDEKTRTGFGIDGNRDKDFEAVRGTLETNKFVKQLNDRKKAVENDFNQVISILK